MKLNLLTRASSSSSLSLSSAVHSQGKVSVILPFVLIVVPIAIFEFTNTTLLITTDMTSAQFKAAAFVLDLAESDAKEGNLSPSSTTTAATETSYNNNSTVSATADNPITIISSPSYSWLFMHVFHQNNTFADYRDLLYQPIKTKEAILVADPHFKWNIDVGMQLQQIYNETKSVAIFSGNVINYDLDRYPYTGLNVNYEGSLVDIRIRNNSNSTS